MKKLIMMLAVIFMTASVASLAQAHCGVCGIGDKKGESAVEHTHDADEGMAALHGYCPVCLTKGKLIKGDPNISTEFKGQTYYFPSEEVKQEFLKTPEVFLDGVEEKLMKLKEEHMKLPMMENE